jgi:dGTPase
MADQRSDRLHPSDKKDDQRTEFERDRDRVLYSSAFRRLAGVTQVVHAAEGHIFHNRLTHTLKVAQTARRIAEHLIRRGPADLIEAVGGIDPDVVETAALAHDLGHPPFGHIAEDELDTQLKNRGIADGFEGNAQSFRIATWVAIKSAQYNGLNLTRASLNAILKYPWARTTAGKHSKKWGYYSSQKEDFDFARALSSPGDERQSAEAAIMDWADDVSYSVHDVDDFYRAGLIPLDRLLADTDERTAFIKFAFETWKEEGETTLKTFTQKAASNFFDQLSFYAGEGGKNDLQIPFSGIRGQRQRLSALSGLLIKRYVVGPVPEIPALTLSNTSQKTFVQINPQLRAEVNLLKLLMRYYVFQNPALVAQQIGHRRVVRELFEVLFEAAKEGSKRGGLIPAPYSDTLKEINGSAELERARLVADLIASMTEQQALTLDLRILGHVPGSVRDLIIR